MRESRLDPSDGSGYGAFASMHPAVWTHEGISTSMVRRSCGRRRTRAAESIPVIRFDRTRQPTRYCRARTTRKGQRIGDTRTQWPSSTSRMGWRIHCYRSMRGRASRWSRSRGYAANRIELTSTLLGIKLAGPPVSQQNVPVDDAVKRMVTEQRRPPAAGQRTATFPTGAVSVMQPKP